MSLKDVPFGEPEAFNVVIEIPRGSQDKYEYDEELDAVKLDLVLYGSQRFLFNYGFIPETWSARTATMPMLRCLALTRLKQAL